MLEIKNSDDVVYSYELGEYVMHQHFRNKIKLHEIIVVNNLYNSYEQEYVEGVAKAVSSGNLQTMLDFIKTEVDYIGDHGLINDMLCKYITDIIRNNLGYKFTIDNAIEDLPDLKPLLYSITGKDDDYILFLKILNNRLDNFAKAYESTKVDGYKLCVGEKKAVAFLSSLFDIPKNISKNTDNGNFEVENVPALDILFNQNRIAGKTGTAIVIMLDPLICSSNIRKYSVYKNYKSNKYVFIREYA